MSDATVRTSDEDVLACFRLLLGRMPVEGELSLHRHEVGAPLVDVVAGFLASPEFEKRGLVRPSVATGADASLATASDILACFRLLLGRPPGEDERRGHFAMAGMDLREVVRSYLNSLEFSRRDMLVAPAPRVAVTDFPRFRIHTDEEDGGTGQAIRGGSYEPDVTAAFLGVVRPGMGVLDIGANVGWFALLAAAIVGPEGHVLAIEPGAGNARLLEASRRLNGFEHLTIAQVAASDAIRTVLLHASQSTGSVGALEHPLGGAAGGVPVAAMPVERLLEPGRRIDVVKIDVDGGEYPAMRGCETLLRRDRPLIFSEFAPDMMPGISGVTGRDYLGFLDGLGYAIGVIRPDGSIDRKGSDHDAVLAAHVASRTTHVDLLCEPR